MFIKIIDKLNTNPYKIFICVYGVLTFINLLTKILITVMDNIQNILSQIGLTKTEVTIYLAGLRYPAISVAELQKQVDIKRPTIYHSLGNLVEKGLAAQSGVENKLKFSMVDPDQLKRLVSKKIDDLAYQSTVLDKIIPELKKAYGKNSDLLKVEHYQGVEGVKTAVDIALYCKSHQWDILAPKTNFFSEFDKNYSNYFLETRKNHNIKARTLWEKKIEGRVLTREEIGQRQPRFIPPAMYGKFKSILILFDDKVLIISSLEQLSAILITSKEVFDLFSVLFDGLWSVSKNYTTSIRNRRFNAIN